MTSSEQLKTAIAVAVGAPLLGLLFVFNRTHAYGRRLAFVESLPGWGESLVGASELVAFTLTTIALAGVAYERVRK